MRLRAPTRRIIGLLRDWVPEDRRHGRLGRERGHVIRGRGGAADDGDWAQILVRGGNATIAQIFNCSFGGPVKIGASAGANGGRAGPRLTLPPLAGALHGTLDCGGGVTFPSGLRSSRIVDAVVLDGAAVHNTDVLARTVVCRGAAVVGCGIVSAPPASAPFTFGNGTVVSVGAEVGGRAVPIAAEMPFNTAVEVASHQGRTGPHRELRAAHEAQIAGYTSAVSCSHAVIGPGAQCLKCPTLTAALVGAAAVVVAATVEEATLCSSADEPVRVEHGAQVRRAALQWGACVTSMALVEDSMMCEHSRVERHGKLFGSVLGPNSSISEGECSGSLVGPFVGFHHQSLLIASFWPEGKGNVGYGANVGSNHTGRAPDQELWPGQGVFFGLGTSIKFPANYRAAPYSIVATGAPQRTACPCLHARRSLRPSKQVWSLCRRHWQCRSRSSTFPAPASQSCHRPSTRCCQGACRPIHRPSLRSRRRSDALAVPAHSWVWLDSAYTVLRSEQKYKSRDKAQRARIGHEVITPAVARDVHRAWRAKGCRRLCRVPSTDLISPVRQRRARL